MPSLRILKIRQKAFYQSLNHIYCPALEDSISFTSSGFYHLLYESNNRPRSVREQYLKLKCLTYVLEVIRGCPEVSQIREIKREIRRKTKIITQYELVYPVSAMGELRVIIEKVGQGKYKFLSIMPHGRRTNKKRP